MKKIEADVLPIASMDATDVADFRSMFGERGTPICLIPL